MFQWKRLAVNTALLTASTLVMRFFGLAYQAWLVGRIGAAGIGLFGLVMSVNMLSATVAVSGSRFACTRLVSEELGAGRGGSIRGAMARCLAYALFFGLAAAVILYCGARPIGFLWIGDARTVRSLRLLAFSLPFLSLSSVIAGYFTACARVWKSAVVQVSEQLLRMALVAVFLGRIAEGDLEAACAAVVLGGCFAEGFACLLSLALYCADRRGHYAAGQTAPRLTARLLGISIPLALSAYARTSLSTLQHLLVPRGLRASGMSADRALSGYGVIQGMVFPILMFPSCLLTALAQMLVPELTAAQVSGREADISGAASLLMGRSLQFSLGAAALLASFADALGQAVYHSAESGPYIRLFALLVPVMYMDMVTDGCLKGLGQMMHAMAINILDALSGLVLVWLLLPRWGLAGYVFMIFVTECFNFFLSALRLHRVARLRLPWGELLLSLLCALGAGQLSAFLLARLGDGLSASPLPLALAIAAGAGLYGLLLRLLRRVPAREKTAA